jgi:dihydroflavonol-4-reductase
MSETSYAIVGGCGFLGQHLVHLLLKNKSNFLIKVIDKIDDFSKIEFMYPEDFKAVQLELHLGVDITKDSEREKISHILSDVTIVFHLAALLAYGHKNKDRLYQVNVKGVENIVTVAKETGVEKLIYVSSFAALGCLDSKYELGSEQAVFQWQNESGCYYALSKYQGEQLAHQAINERFKIAIAVPGLLLGPGPACHASILPFRIAKNQLWALVPEGGTNLIDVRDVALGLISMAEKTLQGKYLLVSHNLEHSEVLKNIAELLNRRLCIIKIPRIFAKAISFLFSMLEYCLPSQSPYSMEGAAKVFKYRYYSHKKASTDLDWSPSYSLHTTLTDTLQWLAKNE